MKLPIITYCCSVEQFINFIQNSEMYQTMKHDNVVFAPEPYGGLAISIINSNKELKKKLADQWDMYIEESDYIIVITKPNKNMGRSISREYRHAIDCGKTIHVYELPYDTYNGIDVESVLDKIGRDFEQWKEEWEG